MTIDQLNTTIIPKISLMVKIITKWRELRELKREKWSFSLSVSSLQFPIDYEKALFITSNYSGNSIFKLISVGCTTF